MAHCHSLNFSYTNCLYPTSRSEYSYCIVSSLWNPLLWPYVYKLAHAHAYAHTHTLTHKHHNFNCNFLVFYLTSIPVSSITVANRSCCSIHIFALHTFHPYIFVTSYYTLLYNLHYLFTENNPLCNNLIYWFFKMFF